MQSERLLSRLASALIVAIAILGQVLAATPAAERSAFTSQPSLALHSPEHPDDTPNTIDPAEVRRWSEHAYGLYQDGEIERAMEFYLLAAMAGDRAALYNAAVIRINGETQMFALDVAVNMLHASASAGFAPAQFALGKLLDTGAMLPADSLAARQWFLRAAAQGHAAAASVLASCYYYGRGGAQDFAGAARWYEVAAMAGDPAAQSALASMFETGLGVPVDLVRALYWYGQAARQGDFAAQTKERELDARVSGPAGR